MRILKVRFRNLNSLAGEWEIDFTHPDYAAGGIFAITGPTGAGKSTILDAICLALYGSTPRLGKITKSGNDIMSRQTGECFAEVCFETSSGRYRCHWGHHRARRKATGELQLPRHEISEIDTGKIIDASLRGVAEQVENLTGMDFDRFTRSMLLAQGGFAAFLQAPPDERGPVLEQITGTEIYSRISMGVHERRSDARARLDVLQAELAGMHLLSEEEVAALVLRRDELTMGDQALQRDVAHYDGLLAWFDELARLQEDLARDNARQGELAVQMQGFAPRRETLARAAAALELQADYAALEVERNANSQDRAALGQAHATLDVRQAGRGEAEAAAHRAAAAHAVARSAYEEALPVLRRVAQLDVQLREAQAHAADAMDAERGLRERQAELAAQQQAALDKLDAQRGERREIETWQGLHAVDGQLAEQLAGIDSALGRLQTLFARSDGRRRAVEAAYARLTVAQQQRNALVQAREHAEAELARQVAPLADARTRLDATLAGRPLTAWREQVHTLQEARRVLDAACVAQAALGEAHCRIEGAQRREQALAECLQQRRAERDAALVAVDALEREEGLLQTQWVLLQRIASLEDARHDLRDGDPCPLCGAREHPFAHDTAIPAPDDTRQQLDAARTALREARERATAGQVALTGAEHDMGQAREAGRQAQAQAATQHDALLALLQQLAQLALQPDAPLPLASEGTALKSLYGGDREALRQAALSALRDTLVDALREAQRVVREADAATQACQGIQSSAEHAQAALGKVMQQTQDAVHQCDMARQAQEQARAEADEADTEVGEARVALDRMLATYGLDTAGDDRAVFSGARATLAARRDAWQARQQRHAEVERDIALLEAKLRQFTAQADSIVQSLAQAGVRRANLDGRCDALRSQRRSLIGDADPAVRESMLAGAVREAEQARDQARASHDTLVREIQGLLAHIDALDATLARRAVRLAEQEPAFAVRLQAAGFADERSFVAARLPDTTRRELAEEAARLDRDHAALALRIANHEERLVQLREQARTDEPRDAVMLARDSLRARHQAMMLELAAVRNRLDDHAALRRTQADRVHTIATQQIECARWDHLHELIGSADGKKFRNFAQGLTFDMMIGHANRQLQNMTDRYLLVRDPAQPLELNVIDNYQAGEVRTAKNLSGGESFIVSLALALGLSSMASRNVRVDSLFLDEGFGTLDEDALDTALSTLGSLQQAGKLIGVISHVPALKERIGTQVRVAPQTGGRSVLAGPGCRRVA